MATDNLHFKNRAGRKKREEAERNDRAVTWLICSEGKTETNYFDGLVNHLNIRIKLELKPLGTSTINVINKAEKFSIYSDGLHTNKIIPYAKTIFAFDKDNFEDNDFNRAIQIGNNKQDSIVAWSNECFELWLCLHFGLRCC